MFSGLLIFVVTANSARILNGGKQTSIRFILGQRPYTYSDINRTSACFSLYILISHDLKTNHLKSDYTFSNVNVPTLNIGFHDPVHTCIKPQNAYNITFETLYNQINAKALEYNYMSNKKIRFSIQEKHQGGEMHFLNNCNKHLVSNFLSQQQPYEQSNVNM